MNWSKFKPGMKEYSKTHTFHLKKNHTHPISIQKFWKRLPLLTLFLLHCETWPNPLPLTPSLTYLHNSRHTQTTFLRYHSLYWPSRRYLQTLVYNKWVVWWLRSRMNQFKVCTNGLRLQTKIAILYIGERYCCPLIRICYQLWPVRLTFI